MANARRNPRVLVVTPEVTYLPDRMGNLASFFTAKAGGGASFVRGAPPASQADQAVAATV